MSECFPLIQNSKSSSAWYREFIRGLHKKTPHVVISQDEKHETQTVSCVAVLPSFFCSLSTVLTYFTYLVLGELYTVGDDIRSQYCNGFPSQLSTLFHYTKVGEARYIYIWARGGHLYSYNHMNFDKTELNHSPHVVYPSECQKQWMGNQPWKYINFSIIRKRTQKDFTSLSLFGKIASSTGCNPVVKQTYPRCFLIVNWL